MKARDLNELGFENSLMFICTQNQHLMTLMFADLAFYLKFNTTSKTTKDFNAFCYCYTIEKWLAYLKTSLFTLSVACGHH